MIKILEAWIPTIVGTTRCCALVSSSLPLLEMTEN
jgi:hypothetical protein